jgi:hypothetical protein
MGVLLKLLTEVVEEVVMTNGEMDERTSAST